MVPKLRVGRRAFLEICLYVIVLATVTNGRTVAVTETSHFDRLCAGKEGGAIDDEAFAFPDSEVEGRTPPTRYVQSIVSPRGINVSYAYVSTRHTVQGRMNESSFDCVVVAAPSLSGHATHTAQWLESLSFTTGCDIAVLEYRGFGLSKQRDSLHRAGMKIGTLASDFHELVTRFASHRHIFLFGLSLGANVLWAWTQIHLTTAISAKVRGILPLEGGLLATPQHRAAASSFDVSGAGAFTWSDIQTMTDRFLSAGENQARCFEELRSFFVQDGFFSSVDLAERYLRGTCDLDCVAFGLLNKDSLFADYTDAVVENVARFRIPVFAFVAGASIIPTSTQEFVANRSLAIPGSVRWALAAADGGVHFAPMPGEPGRDRLFRAMSAFVLGLSLRKENAASLGRSGDGEL